MLRSGNSRGKTARVASRLRRRLGRKSPSMHEMPTVVDLFAGAGGLSLGFVRAGARIIAAYDNWMPAVETYARNVGDHVREKAISRSLAIERPDIIVGGPPCQGFSSAGMRRADDKRNTLVGEFSRLIASVQPRAFVFENVEGFVTGARGAFVFDLLEPLISIGYRIHLRKVNAAHYGVPQHRKRVVAIGGLGWDPNFPEPTHAAFGAPGAHLGNGRRMNPTPTVDEALHDLPSASIHNPSISDHSYEPLRGDDLARARHLKPGQSMRDLPEHLWHESYKRRAFRRVKDGTPSERRGGAPFGVRRLKPNEPSKAITSGAPRELLHPHEDRGLTVRECAVLQTFPIGFAFAGSQRERIQLIGNAVPPLFGERIARSLLADLSEDPMRAGEGALLSFVPTLSSGMSPALFEVTRRVRRTFPPTSEGALLWH